MKLSNLPWKTVAPLFGVWHRELGKCSAGLIIWSHIFPDWLCLGLGCRFWKRSSSVCQASSSWSAGRAVIPCWLGLYAWINRSCSSPASDAGNTRASAGCLYSGKQMLEHLEFCSDRVVRECGRRQVMEGAPVVSTAGWARNIAGFALALLICVPGPMMNSPLKEELERNRPGVFPCFKFQL